MCYNTTMDNRKRDRMVVYLWEDINSPNEVKFGDHFVSNLSLPQAIAHTKNYIRESQGRSKYKFDRGEITIHAIWDVSSLAKEVGRFKQRAHMDDYIRDDCLPNRIGRGEFHKLSGDGAVTRVNEFLAKQDQPLPVCGLSTFQYLKADEVLYQWDQGNLWILAELCARFGKTIWAGSLILESGSDLAIICSYVKTAFTSFKKDLTSFEQFKDWVHVDTQDKDYQKQINSALRDGKKVVAYVSMCQGEYRASRLDFLSRKRKNKIWIIDEADYGTHQKSQTEALQTAVGWNDKLILMTGTNADRAVSSWRIDHILSVTYPELLIQKETKKKFPKSKLIENFKIDPLRDQLYPGIEFYQADLASLVEDLIQKGKLTDEELKLLPSWSKFAANPAKAKGFFAYMLESLFFGKRDDLNVEQMEDYRGRDSRISMMFFSAGATIECLKIIEKVARGILPGYEIILACGGSRINGKKVTNGNIEKLCRDAVERCRDEKKNLLILSAIIGQRSFSIPELDEVYLAYDSGEVGSTIQKMSRALTPNGADKIGRVISLSFDPNRDDKLDDILLQTAVNYQKTHQKKSLAEALQEVLRTISIFEFSEDGRVEIEPDNYLDQAFQRDSVSRIIGQMADLTLLDEEELRLIAEAHKSYNRLQKTKITPKGKTKEASKEQSTKRKESSEKIFQKAREVIIGIVEDLDILLLGTGKDRLHEALAVIRRDSSMKEDVETEFGLTFEVLEMLLESGVINQKLVELQHEKVSI